MSTIQNANGPAEGATSPDHGSNKSQQDKVMNGQTNTTGCPAMQRHLVAVPRLMTMLVDLNDGIAEIHPTKMFWVLIDHKDAFCFIAAHTSSAPA